jgi:carboxymethylenebutenolidase
MAHNGNLIKMTGSDGFEFDVYHVEPTGDRKGGLVLIQEIFGVTDHIKEVCDGYAEDGYEVLAPSLYDRAHPGFQATYAEDDVARAIELAGKFPPPDVLDDIQLAIDQLKAKGPVFMTGYCYGGSVCWVAACRSEGLSAVAGYYGRLAAYYADQTPECPIIMHFGEHDASIPMSDVKKIQDLHPDIPIYVYDAGHGFNSDRRADYNEECAKLARERTLALFEENR